MKYEMNLTKDTLLDMLKRAYMRGMYEHMDQRYRSIKDVPKQYPTIHISNHIVEDLIQE